MRSLAFMLLIAVSLPAQAQKAQKRPASTLKEQDGEDDQKPAKAPPSAADPTLCGDRDRALGLALAHAFEQAPEEIRVVAVEDLGLLGDPRALDALSTIILDTNPRVQSAAIRAISQFTAVRATQILENVVRHPRIAIEIKDQALRALPFQRRVRAREFLIAVTNAVGYPPPLRKTAQETLTSFDPALAPTPKPTGGPK